MTSTGVDYYAILSKFQMYEEIRLLHQAASSIIAVAESSSTYIIPRKLLNIHKIGGTQLKYGFSITNVLDLPVGVIESFITSCDQTVCVAFKSMLKDTGKLTVIYRVL